MQASTRIVIALETLKGLFLETPNLRLSLREASEIAGLEPNVCRELLAALLDVRFLAQEWDGAYYKRLTPATEASTPVDAAMPSPSNRPDVARLDPPRLA